MAEKLLTQKDFKDLTGKDRSWQWKARNAGRLGYYDLNGQIRYSERHLQEFLERCENPAITNVKQAMPEAA